MLKYAFIGLAIAGFTAGWQQAGRDFSRVHSQLRAQAAVPASRSGSDLQTASLRYNDRWLVEQHRRANESFKREAQRCAAVAPTLRPDCLWQAESRHDARTAAALKLHHRAWVMQEPI